MKLPRCTLTKNGNELILQGMSHVSLESFFNNLQDDLDGKLLKGYQVFYEKIYQDSELSEEISDKELAIINFIVSIAKLSEKLDNKIINKEKYRSRMNALEYPENAINADISFITLVKLLAEKGFDCECLSDTLQNLNSDENRRLEVFSFIFGASDASEIGDINKSNDEQFKANIKILFSVIIDCRNINAVKIVEKNLSSLNILYYGQKHIQGIYTILINNGWKLTKSSKIEF